MFYQALNRVKGWQTMRVTEAAQRVQKSAYPEAYQQWATSATVLAQALVGKAPGSLACARLAAPATRGSAAVASLGAGLRADWGDLPVVTSAGGVTVTSATAAAGWQYAHWLVAQGRRAGHRPGALHRPGVDGDQRRVVQGGRARRRGRR